MPADSPTLDAKVAFLRGFCRRDDEAIETHFAWVFLIGDRAWNEDAARKTLLSVFSMLGADPLVAGLMLHSAHHGRPLDGFLVRRSAKDHGTRGQVEGNLAGHRRVVILDDVITSGESALTAAEAAESYRAQVVRILAVVDRNQGAAQVFQQRGYPFTALFTVNELLPAERE